jgi:hypothetical protein
MDKATALLEGAEYAKQLGLPTEFSRVWRGESWWVLVIKGSNPDHPFMIINDDFTHAIEQIPVGSKFQGLVEQK